MDKPRANLTPLVTASLLLLLPVLYVWSYFVLVVRRPAMVYVSLTYPTQYSADYYRVGGDYAETFYWPLEQIDRKLQPDAWDSDGLNICNGR